MKLVAELEDGRVRVDEGGDDLAGERESDNAKETGPQLMGSALNEPTVVMRADRIRGDGRRGSWAAGKGGPSAMSARSTLTLGALFFSPFLRFVLMRSFHLSSVAEAASEGNEEGKRRKKEREGRGGAESRR